MAAKDTAAKNNTTQAPPTPPPTPPPPPPTIKLELSVKEAAVVLHLVGKISKKGQYRKVSSGVFYALFECCPEVTAIYDLLYEHSDRSSFPLGDLSLK
jgi:hypothetical protein